MANLSTKIKLYANKEIDFTKDVRLQDNSDGKGVFIAEWNLDIPKPTLEQLNAFEAQATTYENNQAKYSNRKEYGALDKQLEEITKMVRCLEGKVRNNIKADNPKE
jgi:signal transduction protein with GAF and PtsI domain